MKISMISAMTEARVIGLNNKMPWHVPTELQHFKKVTMGKPMIMGRNTFDAIGRRLLPGRRTIVLTRDTSLSGEGFDVAHSKEEALALAAPSDEVMIIGGAKIYELFLPQASTLYLSLIPGVYEGDTFFPSFSDKEWKLKEEHDNHEFTVKIFEKIT